MKKLYYRPKTSRHKNDLKHAESGSKIAKGGSQICQIRLPNELKQAHRYAKPGSRLCQIRLKNKTNQAHMPYKYAKPGTQIYQNQAQIRRPLRDPQERKIQLSFPLQSRTKASDTPTTRRSKLGVKTRKLSAL